MRRAFKRAAWAIAVVLAALLAGSTRADFTLYGSDYGSNLYGIDSDTGVATRIGTFSPSFFAAALDFRGTGDLYGVSTSLQIVNVTTAGTTPVGGDLPEQMSGLAFSPGDQLFTVSLGVGVNRLYQLNPDTGEVIGGPLAITYNAPPFTFNSISGIAFGPDGTLYGIGTALFQIDPTTGVATRIDLTGVGSSTFQDLDFGPDGLLRSVAFSASDNFYAIDPTTGQGTLIGTVTDGATGQGVLLASLASYSGVGPTAFSPVSTPEPATLALFGLGLAGLAGYRWRRTDSRR
jgi:hypothetical protein